MRATDTGAIFFGLSGLDELARELDFPIFDAGRTRNVTGRTVYWGFRLKRRLTHRCYRLALGKKSGSLEIFRKKAIQWNSMTDVPNHVYERSELVLQRTGKVHLANPITDGYSGSLSD